MKRGEEERREPDIYDVARDTRRKAAFLLRKPFIEQAEVYGLAKAFFKAYLKKPYEFTAQELTTELHKVYLSSGVRARVEALIAKLGLMEYTDTRYSQAEARILLQDLDTIVKELVVEHKKRLPFLTRFANWLFRKRERPRETVLTEYPALEENDRPSVEINELLEESYAALDRGKAKRAAKRYRLALRKYDSLGPSAQQRFYHKMQAAYDAIVKQGR